MSAKLLTIEKETALLKNIFQQSARIAIVGAKDKAGQPVDRVGRYLIEQGYEVLPVHPKRTNVWGLTTYEQLSHIPFALDIVDIFRADEYCPQHAREALALAHAPRLFWMQLGIQSAEATRLLAQGDIFIVENACIMVEHKKIFGIMA